MVGGGNRKEDGSLGISNNNVFAALDSLRKKKKSDKSKASAKSQPKEPQPQPPQVFWAPTPLTVKSWADVDDDDDDDYFATTAPPQRVWASSEQQKSSAAVDEETESEDDGLNEMYEDIEEEPEHEPEVQPVPVELVGKPLPTPVVPKDTERQLSKKEMKKKELAELDAVLAELGISAKEDNVASQNETQGTIGEKGTETNGEAEECVSAPSESKTSKKKKKKEKPTREVKDHQERPGAADGNGTDEASADPGEDSSTVDLERLKKMVSMKKKKLSKETDAAAKVAAVEAAARSARLAAAKKKEKNHYNQQPVR